MYNVSSIFDTITAYGGYTCYISLFLLCVIYCFFTMEHEKKKTMICIMILCIVCIYNDGVRYLISKFTDLETYYRFLWMIPVLPMLSYCIVDLVFRIRELVKRIVVVFLLIVVVAFGGNSYLTAGSFQLPENRYNIPNEVIGVCDMIRADGKSEQPVVVADKQIQLPLRTYDASFLWGVSREAWLAVTDRDYDGQDYQTEAIVIKAVQDGEKTSATELSGALSALNIDYLVIQKDYEMDSYLADAACSKVGEIGEYSVYYYDRDEAAALEAQREQSNLQLETVDLVVPGVTGDYTFLFLSDTHVETESEDNTEQVEEYAKERNTGFVNANGVTSWEQFPRWMDLPNEYQVDAVLLGGDIIDSPSESNLAFLKKELSTLQMPYLFALGNHDWTYPWNYMTEEGKEEYLPLLSEAVGNTAFSKLEFPDLVIAAVDDSTDQVNEDAISGAESTMQEGKPVILMMHVPLYNEELAEQAKEIWGNPIVLGKGGIEPDETSQKLLDMVYDENSPVAAVLAGHVHFRAQGNLNDHIVQIVSDGSFTGNGILLKVHGS